MKAIFKNIVNLDVNEMLAYTIANKITSSKLVDIIYDCEAENDDLEQKLEELEEYYEYDCDCGGYWIDSNTQEEVDELNDRIESLDSFMKVAEEVSNILDNQE